jgi:hypothetical protein
VQLWDTRLLPTELGDGAEYSSLPSSSRRCLAATIPLPAGAACARQLHLDGSRLLCSVDHDGGAGPFARGAQSVALYDVRAASSGTSDSGSGALLWEQHVRGDVSCFQCRGERVLIGTATGSVHLWDFRRDGQPAPQDGWEGADERPEKREKREKWRAKVKLRGRFPKTQGFSNSRGFGR